MAKIDKFLMSQGGEIDLDAGRSSRSSQDRVGGVKVKESLVHDTPHPTRYGFTITGTAPKTLVLSDLTTMLEARFRGEIGNALTRSRDEAVTRLKARLDERIEALKGEEEKYNVMAKGLAEKKAQYEKSVEDIKEQVTTEALAELPKKRDELLKDLNALERDRTELQAQLANLKDTVQSRQQAREAAEKVALNALKVHPVSGKAFIDPARVSELAESLVEGWRENLSDYGQPMASEYDELVSLIAKSLTKLVDRMNDVVSDKTRELMNN
jgi:chromosome segregation ATPase